ncbi:MAG: hypothetical protein KGY65_02140, partial [Candidatus Thermoplasmatota archaeon]|nr:hypothetical protein [Candidatus Thermoplasmatota archaeon]MBS3801530.1 hypothetical protein [Candidatus Thermoplasmatota archaeon]
MNLKYNWFSIKILFLIVMIVLASWSGCLSKEQNNAKENETKKSTMFSDFALKLPSWINETYHDYERTEVFLSTLEERFPDYVEMFSIGKSVLNRDIWCAQITNEKKFGEKYDCVFDGCIHGNEWEAGESCLYLAEYILINKKNASMKSILNESNIFIIPLLNPDGRESDERWNENGIDL